MKTHGNYLVDFLSGPTFFNGNALPVLESSNSSPQDPRERGLYGGVRVFAGGVQLISFIVTTLLTSSYSVDVDGVQEFVTRMFFHCGGETYFPPPPFIFQLPSSFL